MKREYLQRREKLMEKILEDSAILFFSSTEKQRNSDNKYPYRQNSDFFYFTGLSEPWSLLVLVKRKDLPNISILFNAGKNIRTYRWKGVGLEQTEVTKKLGIDIAIPWKKIYGKLPDFLQGLETIYHAFGESKFADNIFFRILSILRNRRNFEIPSTFKDWRPIVHNMRLIKSKKEIEIIRKACKISSLAHTRAMKFCKPNIYEYEIEAEIRHEFIKRGARSSSYETIVGSGRNGCILHYTRNSDRLIRGDLVLVDAGCEYLGYASDITRTFPISGKFTKLQLILYKIVLSMFEKAIKKIKPGLKVKEIKREIMQVMAKNLVEMSFLKGSKGKASYEEIYKEFSIHEPIHSIGLDVHDNNFSSFNQETIIQPNMVLSLEPGLYIDSNSNFFLSNYTAGIRIEDTILITETGNEILTSSVEKYPNLIEKIMTNQ